MNNNFLERKRDASAMLVDFLNAYSVPRGLSADGQAERITHTADAFARRISENSDFQSEIKKVFTKVRDTHLSNSWPSQAAFVMAMPSGKGAGRSSPETFKVEDQTGHIAAKMRAGDTVPETAIWGRLSGSLPGDLLERYRNGSVHAWMKAYKRDAHKLMRSRYGVVVDGYFPSAQAQERAQ
jgi:hypothetical protein